MGVRWMFAGKVVVAGLRLSAAGRAPECARCILYLRREDDLCAPVYKVFVYYIMVIGEGDGRKAGRV